MIKGRSNEFGVCKICNFIYVVGCVSDEYGSYSDCERYDIYANKWRTLAASFEFPVGVSLITTSNRYVHAFGGRNFYRKVAPTEIIRTFDNLRPNSRWKIQSLQRPYPSACGSNFGLLNIVDDDLSSILVFGGFHLGPKEECMIFKSEKTALQEGELLTLSNNLLEKDEFKSTNVFPISSSFLSSKVANDMGFSPETKALLRDLRQPHSKLMMAVGDRGLHIFDMTQRVWISFI